MLIVDTIPLYLADKQRKKPLSPNTLKQYTHALRKLAEWIGPDASLKHLSEARLQAYFDYLLDVKHYTRTLHLQWIVLAGWQRWLVKSGRVDTNFLPDVELPKWTAPKPQYISDQEAASLVLACAKIEDEYKRIMVTALITVLTTSCLRHDEIISLRVKDVSVSDYWIEVQKGKGDKYRRFKMNDQCVDALRAYLAVRPKDCTHDFLFARSIHWRVGYEGLWTTLEEVKALAGLANAALIVAREIGGDVAASMRRLVTMAENMALTDDRLAVIERLTTALDRHTEALERLPAPDDALLEAHAVQQCIPRSPAWLRRHVPSVKIGRSRLWKRSVVLAYIASL